MTSEKTKKTRRVWTEEEVEYLTRAYPDESITIKEIRTVLGRNAASISKKAQTLNLKRTKRKTLEYLITGEKMCTKCKRVLPLNYFIKRSDSKNAYRSHCRDCRTLDNSQLKLRNKLKELEQEMNKTTITHKTCRDCNEEKEISKFYKNKGVKDGYENYCKVCSNIRKEKSVLRLLTERGF